MGQTLNRTRLALARAGSARAIMTPPARSPRPSPLSRAITAASKAAMATVSTDIKWLQHDHRWPGLQIAIGKVDRIARPPAKRRLRSPITCSISLVARTLQRGGPGALGGRNRLHWRLDVIMNEDQNRTAWTMVHRTSRCCDTGAERHAEGHH